MNIMMQQDEQGLAHRDRRGASFMTQPLPVTWVNVMGSNWGNENRGGFTFNLDPMPGDVVYFIVRPMDVGLEMFLTGTLHAVANKSKVEVEYSKLNAQEDGRFEAEVVAMRFYTT